MNRVVAWLRSWVQFQELLREYPCSPRSEVNKRGRPSKWPPSVFPQNLQIWVCVFPIIPWRKDDSQRPLFGGDFLGQILAADSLPGAFVHSRWELPRAWPFHPGASFLNGVHAKGVVLCERACFCLLSPFYNTPPSKNPSKNLCLYWNPYKAPSKNPSKKHLLVENLLRTLRRSVRLHDPLRVSLFFEIGMVLRLP